MGPAIPAGLPFPAGPLGTLSQSDFESAGHVGPVGTLPPCDNVMGLLPIVPVGELSSVNPVRRAPGGWSVLVVWTEFPDGRDPASAQLPAEVLVGDYRDVVDIDDTVDSCQAVPEVVEDRFVVAMVGLDAIRMGEDTPMDYECKCAEWDIRNEFETIDGMPVYYGGDLCDSDESDWEDPRDLAYAEYVDLYNFDAPEGIELKVVERSRAVDGSVMMVGEATGLGHMHQTLSSCSLLEADMVCKEPMADILTVRHDVPVFKSQAAARSRGEMLSPVPSGPVSMRHARSAELESESPRRTRHESRRMRPVRVLEESVGDLPTLTVQDPSDLQGAIVYDCRPPLLPVSLQLDDIGPLPLGEQLFQPVWLRFPGRTA